MHIWFDVNQFTQFMMGGTFFFNLDKTAVKTYQIQILFSIASVNLKNI
jgi:hypothetical protein